MIYPVDFEAELAGLAGKVGERNRRLLPLARLGLRAGFSAEELIGRIVEGGGNPPLSEAEVRRAVEKVAAESPWHQGALGRYSHRSKARFAGTDPKITNKNEDFRDEGLVRAIIDVGGGEATSADLKALSKRPVPTDGHLQAIEFCRAIKEPDSRFFFVGEPMLRRTRDTLADLDSAEFWERLRTGALPTHIMPNDLTGESALNERGEESFALESCIRHRRYAVIEFDDLPLKVQAAFWVGAIRRELLPVRTLVYSGGKSIHALLRLKDDEDFARQWLTLAAALAADPDPAYRCDIACRNPGRLTRFAGAIRAEGNRRQELLYLGTNARD